MHGSGCAGPPQGGWQVTCRTSGARLRAQGGPALPPAAATAGAGDAGRPGLPSRCHSRVKMPMILVLRWAPRIQKAVSKSCAIQVRLGPQESATASPGRGLGYVPARIVQQGDQVIGGPQQAVLEIQQAAGGDVVPPGNHHQVVYVKIPQHQYRRQRCAGQGPRARPARRPRRLLGAGATYHLGPVPFQSAGAPRAAVPLRRRAQGVRGRCCLAQRFWIGKPGCPPPGCRGLVHLCPCGQGTGEGAIAEVLQQQESGAGVSGQHPGARSDPSSSRQPAMRTKSAGCSCSGGASMTIQLCPIPDPEVAPEARVRGQRARCASHVAPARRQASALRLSDSRVVRAVSFHAGAMGCVISAGGWQGKHHDSDSNRPSLSPCLGG
jgi:hypothetical protein